MRSYPSAQHTGALIEPPTTFLPDPGLARNLSAQIRHKLADSLRELSTACCDAVAFDESALQHQAEAVERCSSVRPGLFLLYYECLVAARRDDLEALAPRLRRLATASVPDAVFTVRGFGDASLSRQEWSLYQRALLAEPDTSTELGPVPATMFEAALYQLVGARRALETADPALAAEIGHLINEVVFATDQQGAGLGFGGATSFYAWGAVFLNPRRHPSVVSMVGGLVHEAAHALLFGLSAGEAVVENDTSERYASPLRADKRPMEGIFHATFVSARMCYAMDRLLASDVLQPSQRQEAIDARDQSCRSFRTGHRVVNDHARPTDIGRSAMRGAEAYMASAAGGETRLWRQKGG